MIVHIAEVWVALLAAFTLGCFAGAGLFMGVERSPLGVAQWALADAIGRVVDSVRDRLGMAPLWRHKWRSAKRVAVPKDPDPKEEAGTVWEVVDRAVDAILSDVDQASPHSDVAQPASMEQRPATPERTSISRGVPLRRLLPPRAPDVVAPFDGSRHGRAPLSPRPVPMRAEAPPPLALQPPPLLTGPIGDTPLPEDGIEVRRPVLLPEPRNGVPDNLQRIRGIGERNEVRLNALGIFHFSQIAAWTPAEIQWIGQRLAFADRIERDDWVGQAIVLASGGETGFVKSADRRRARRRGHAVGETGPGPDESDEP